MKDWRRVLGRAILLAVLGGAVGLAVNLGHIMRYFRGDYRLVFSEVPAAEDPSLISLPEAADLFAAGQAVFVDARSPEEYDAGHIDGAKSVPLYDPGSDMTWESLAVPQETLIVVYCSGDLCQDGLVLARRLVKQGWRNTRVYAGGWVEWNAAGLPVERGR